MHKKSSGSIRSNPRNYTDKNVTRELNEAQINDRNPQQNHTGLPQKVSLRRNVLSPIAENGEELNNTTSPPGTALAHH